MTGSSSAGVHAMCDACGVGWLETPRKRPVAGRRLTYPGGLTLVMERPERSRITTIWTLGEWRCQRDGLTVQLYRKDYLTEAVTVPDDHHARECAARWLAGLPATGHARARRRHAAKKDPFPPISQTVTPGTTRAPRSDRES
jgi:hypothetical protein